ncbi:alternative thymidylate synthase [Thiovulum sp. ES]|nr:alternative thymidylate synthase [Thiovulum sp. ES]
MEIQFLDTAENPLDVAVSSARTCYSAKGIITPQDSTNWKRKEKLLLDLFKSGHHTTLQHTHITMMISGVSRHLIWRLLHSHNFYISEQISQRYAKMKLENVYLSESGNSEKWNEFYQKRFGEYEKLTEILTEHFQKTLPKFQRKSANKKAMEIARYVLPQGVTATLYHTVNILTLLRYISVAKTLPESRNEAMRFAEILKSKLIQLDPIFEKLIEVVKKEKTSFPENDFSQFDNLGKVFDLIGNFDFETENYSTVLRNSQMLHDTGILGGVSTISKISLSADAQNQRHRRSLGIRQKLETDFQKDFYIPTVFKENSESMEIYQNSMNEIYKFFDEQKDEIGFSDSVYALPNSHLVKIVERSDLSSFQHKTQMRLCYNAQEEIWQETYDQVKDIREKNISGSQKLLPPCTLRFAEKKFPLCPEGDRFCGVKVWKLDFSQLKR